MRNKKRVNIFKADRVIAQDDKVEFMYFIQWNMNMNENSVISDVKSYVLLTLVGSLCHACVN